MGQIAQRRTLDTQLFRDVFHASPIGIAVGSLDRQILFVNAAFCSFLGLSEEELRNKPCADFSPPEDAERDWELFQQLRAGSIDHYQLEKRYFLRDGSLVWGRLSLSLLNRRPSPMVIAMVEDISEKKRAEEELANANERLQLAIASGSVGVWDFDLKTGKNVWFGQAHAQLGMAPDETPGSIEQFWGRVHEDDRERLRHAIQLARDTHEGFSEDFRVVWRDGRTHWLRSRGRYQYLANGEPERVLGISIDITESKDAEQALRDSEQRLRLAAQTGRMSSFEWDVATVALRSPQHVRILDSTEPLHLSHQQFVKIIHPDDRTKFISTIAGLTPENPSAEIIYRVRGSDGGLVWLKSSGLAFFDSQGKMLRVIGMLADVTDLKRAEEALSEMTRRLIESQEQERARIGRELHDDINQRLALLALEIDQLERNPSEVASRAQELRKAVDDLATDVHALSHELHSSKLEYLGVVGGIKSWCKEFAGRQKLQIVFKTDTSSVLPLEIGVSLLRVLQETLHNATKHSGAKRIEVQLREHSGEIHLIVRDSGKGFDVEAALQGKGLGLTSMRERVRLVNGTISIESKPTAGTTVHVRVPSRSARR